MRDGVTEGNLSGTGWTRVRGKLAQVSAGVGALWGVNANGGIFCRSDVSGSSPTGTAWDRCPGTLRQVSVGTSEMLSTTTALAETGSVEGAVSSPSRRQFQSDLLDSPSTLERLGMAEAGNERDWLDLLQGSA